MVMEGGYDNIETLAEAGRHEKANQLMRLWADSSASDNDAASLLRFARMEVCKLGRWWTGVHLLERFLKKPGLSAKQRYEGLALRAIALHKIDRLLANPKSVESERRQGRAQWILSTMSAEDVARRVAPALRQALSAWQSLGAARSSDAKPYSTADMMAYSKNFMGFAEATPLQETSAQLAGVIRERASQTAARRSRTRR